MKLRTFAALFLASGMALAAAPASAQTADTSNVMGLRFEATLFNPFDVRGATFRPEGDIRIGYDLPMGLTPMVGFGLRTQAEGTFNADNVDTGSTGETELVIAAELRYYFSPHKRGLQPFVFGEFDTTIASFGTEAGEGGTVSDLRKAQDKASGDAASFTNLNAGLGMEYKFAKSFGIGAKWGFGLSFAGTSIQKVGDAEAGENTSNTVFGTSSSIYAAFRI